MKKIGLILVILLMITFGVWATTDASSTLKISTSVEDKFGLVIHTEDDPVDYSDFMGLGSNAVGTTDDPVSFDDTDINNESERVLTVSAMTNKTSGYEIGVIANPLSAQGVSTKIGYTVRILGTPDTVVSVSDSDSNKTFNLKEFNAPGGLFIISQKFGITIDQEGWENAGAGDYSTTWTVNLTTT